MKWTALVRTVSHKNSNAHLNVLNCMVCLLAMSFGGALHAGQAGDYDFYIVVPFTNGEDLEFDGGAEAKIEDDIGFGFGFGTFITKNLVVRGNMTWNSASYSATRILDDGNNSREVFGGKYDSSSLSLGADYYFTTGRFSPFVSADLGLFYIDSNIPSGRPVSQCWWDPWYGYTCDSYQPSFGDNTWFYGVGAGARMEFGRSNFFKLGYYERWVDFDRVSGSPSFGIFRFEFGWSGF